MKQRNFFWFLTSYTLYNLASQASMMALPLLVTQRFGMGNALITSLVLRLLPHLVCAPFVGNILLKKGPRPTAAAAILALASSMIVLPYITHYQWFQSLNLCMGVLSMAAVTSLLTLRTQVIPPGKNVPANAMLTTLDRLAQVTAPSCVGILLWCYPTSYIFYVLAVFLLFTAFVVWKIKINLAASPSDGIPFRASLSYIILLRLFNKIPELWAVFIPALGYALIIGAMTPFLFFSTTQTFNNPESRWTLLLTFHGLGTMVGSVIAPQVIAYLSLKVNMLAVYLWMRLLQDMCLAILAFVADFWVASVALMVAGMPATIGSVCFFTMLQKSLTSKQEGLFHTLSFPLFSAFVMLGTACGQLYTGHCITLQHLWLLIVATSILTTLPFLLWYQRRNGHSY